MKASYEYAFYLYARYTDESQTNFSHTFTCVCSFPASDGEQLHPRADVFVLRTRRIGTLGGQVSLVEEVLDDPSAHPVYDRFNIGH